MKLRSLAFSIMLAAIIASCIAPLATAQNEFVTVPEPHESHPNQILDFYAGGTSGGGYSIRVSPQGGTLSINDYLEMNLMPWGYVTAQWSTGPVYIIFLVNVTETNFRIGFLYLTNNTAEAFLLRWFDYSSDNINVWTFQGVQHVYNRTVSTVREELPKLNIPDLQGATNTIYALGARFFLTSQGGSLINDTNTLQIHPLMNQLFDGPKDFNEVWSLLEGSAGDYYFAILYMQNSDPSHVIVEHILRLNDYRRFNGLWIEARWSKGAFVHDATIRTGLSNLTVKVNGFPFQTNTIGIVSLGVPGGIVTIEVPNEIVDSTGSRLGFSSWNKYGSSNPLSVQINSSLDVTAKYGHEYSLVVASGYGTPQGGGWYPSGTNASFSVENAVELGNGARQIFERWEGDSNSTNNAGWIIINSPKHIAAVWQTQFQVTLSSTGIPSNASAVVLLGNTPVTLLGSQPYTQWVDANQQLTVQTTLIQTSSNNYFFAGLRSDNQTLTGPVILSKSMTVLLVYTQTPKQTTALSLQVSPSVAAPGYPVTITGSVDHASGSSAMIYISYSSNQNDWQKVATVPLTQNGGFAYTWHAGSPGDYSFKAFWPGDSTHSSAAQVVNVRVVDSSVPILTGTSPVGQFVQTSLATAKQVPYVSFLIRLAETLMLLGSTLAVLFLPAGPPIVGYLIGSILVGFVFVFPLAAILASVNSAKTSRAPSLALLIPGFTIWLFALGLNMMSPSLGVPPDLATFSEGLLVLSNAFMIPLLAAFSVAKLVQ